MKRYPDEIVYVIKNTTTGFVYYGITTDLYQRMCSHFSNLNNQKHSSKLMQEDFNKFGRDTFVYAEVKRFKWTAFRFQAKHLEKILIHAAKNCYNVKGNPLHSKHKQLEKIIA